MSQELKLRRGTTAEHAVFTGANGEVTVDTEKKTLVVHDGLTPGGSPMMPADVAEAALATRVMQVATIADLRALEPAFDGQQVELLGHTVAGIGGGPFYADYSSSELDDDGVTVVTVGGRRWVRRLDGCVTPDMYGAVRGGYLNPASLLQTMIDNNASINICDADFSFSGAVTINKPFTFAGYGGTLTHSPTEIGQAFITVTGNDVVIEGVEFFGLGSRAVNRIPETLAFSNCIFIHGDGCSRLRVSGCRFEQNSHGVKLTGALECKVQGNTAVNTASYSYWISNCDDVLITGNSARGTGADGFKTTAQNVRLVIDGNISTGNRRDGFDLYDGFRQSVLSNNIAEDNYLNGFECKGTFASDYEFRDSVVVGNVAQNNSTDPTIVVGGQQGAGFSVASVRGGTFTGNVSTENVNHGFIVENCQEDIFNGNLANKNGAHGYWIAPSSNVSRTGFVGNHAADNSAATANTYDGFHFGASASVNATACESHKGTSPSANDQRYGYGFTSGANVNLIACNGSGNVSGSTGGTPGSSKIVLAPGWSQQTYTISNYTTSRSVNAGTVTTAQLASAFCTLVQDLKTIGLIK